ncbi:DUF2771 domain-containing protein [Nocardia sp. NBC_00565]|uniref:DUF2771 domain-containing protein n=1 Tax=Nocardia sp. NBC_00565 TaxID=2975993 RepID=UPI002E809258|nr:DUF2771 domain-containing protein [Nocardia sp. NBC_00565]WUC02643.1 DUF2771 domain-containing protein [Nocardia sp. NBC_00565]
MSKPNTRTVVALAVAALSVLTVAFVGVLTVLVRKAEHHDPTVTAYAHGKTVTVEPFLYCTVKLEDCKYGETVALEVPAGYPLQLSLPKKIADAPWLAQLVYVLPNGDKVDRVVSRNDFPEGALAVTIDSKPEDELRLVGVELQLPILARDETGREFYVPHAAWSISTV